MSVDTIVDAIKEYVQSQEVALGNTTAFNCDRRQVSAAIFLIKLFLGHVWFKEHIMTSRPNSWVSKPVGEAPEFARQGRICRLGELLLNLHQIPGFDGRLNSLKTEGPESVIGELECSSLLKSSGIPFNFVDPVGERGRDYEIDATIDGNIVAIEVKTKLQSTSPTSGTVFRSLKEARDQLPSDRPGVVFLNLPEMWLLSSEGRKIVELGIAKAWRHTKHTAGVVVCWEAWRSLGSKALHGRLFRYFQNPSTRYPLSSLDAAVKSWVPGNEDSWKTLDSIVCSREVVQQNAAVGLAVVLQQYVFGNAIPPPEFVFIASVGEYSRVESLPSEQATFVFDFESAEFDLFKGSTESAFDVRLANGPARFFVVVQDPGATAFAIRIKDGAGNMRPELRPIVERIQGDATAVAMGKAFMASPNAIFANPLLVYLRSICDQMRAEGDLTLSPCTLRKLVFFVFDEETKENVFAIKFIVSEFSI